MLALTITTIGSIISNIKDTLKMELTVVFFWEGWQWRYKGMYSAYVPKPDHTKAKRRLLSQVRNTMILAERWDILQVIGDVRVFNLKQLVTRITSISLR